MVINLHIVNISLAELATPKGTFFIPTSLEFALHVDIDSNIGQFISHLFFAALVAVIVFIFCTQLVRFGKTTRIIVLEFYCVSCTSHPV